MAKNNDLMDLSPRLFNGDGRARAPIVPRYILYGDASDRPDWFVNVEQLDQRSREIGWIIEPHTHPRFTQIVICKTGGGKMSIEGETLPFAAGNVMIVPPHRVHGFHYLESTFGWVLTVENSYLTDLLVRAPALKAVVISPGVFVPSSSIFPVVGTELEALSAELQDMRAASAIGAEIHLLSILLLLLRHWPDTTRQTTSGRSVIVDRFKEIVEREYRQQPMLPDIAAELHISVSQLRLACKAVAGISPIEITWETVLSDTGAEKPARYR